MISFNHPLWWVLHFTCAPTFGEFMHIIPHNLLSDESIWAHPCCLTPTGQERVSQDEAHGGCCDEFVRGLGRRLPVDFLCQGWILDPVIFIFYFVRLPLCNKYSDYCDIYLYTLCYYICCLLWRMYEMHPTLFLNARVWQKWYQRKCWL